MPRTLHHPLLAAAGGFGLLVGLLGGCTSAIRGDLPLMLGAQPNPSSSASPAATASVGVARDVLPFKVGDHFEYALRYLSALPAGTLKLDVASDTVASDGEHLGLNITDPLGKSKLYPLDVMGGMFLFDSKPYLPTSIHSGEFLGAGDGLVSVEGRESVDVPAGHFPYCYQVLYTNSRSEAIRLWLSPHYGLVKGVFNLQLYAQGEIDLTSGPATGST